MAGDCGVFGLADAAIGEAFASQGEHPESGRVVFNTKASYGDDDDVEEDIWLARRPAAGDPDNHPAVLVHAFTKICESSRDFAYVLHLLTGWPMMAVRVQTDDTGSSEISFVRNPDGKLLDASG